MKKIMQTLVDFGFSVYRKRIFNGVWIYEQGELNDYYSSCVSGMLDIRLIYGDLELVFGLLEPNMPPTLILPRIGNSYREIEKSLPELTVRELSFLARLQR